jgi:O-antigen ligase
MYSLIKSLSFKEYFTKHKIQILFNYLFVLYAFIMPIDMSKIDGILAVLIIFLLINLKYKELIFLVKKSRLFQSILLLSLLILISYIWSNSQSTVPAHDRYSDIYYYYYRYIIFFLLPIIMIVTNLKKEFIPIVINSFIFAMFINEIISYGIFFELWTTPYGIQSNPLPFHRNHITYSAFIGFTILLSIYKFSHLKNNYMKLFYLLFLTTMTINLFMSAGRTGQFSLFLTAIALTFIYFRKNIKILILSFLILIITFLLAFNNMETFHKRITTAGQDIENIFDGKNLDTSMGTRIIAFDTIPYLVTTDNILFGVGMGDKPYHVSNTLKNHYPHRLNNFDIHGYLHNSHLEMFVSNGLVGLFLYFSIFYFTFTARIKDPFIKYIARTLSIYFICFGMSADIFFWKEMMSLFAFFLGIIILQSQLEKKIIDG